MTITYLTLILFGLYMYVRESMYRVAPSVTLIRQSENQFLGYEPDWQRIPLSTGGNVIALPAIGKPKELITDYVSIERTFGHNGIVYYNEITKRRCSISMPKAIAKGSRFDQWQWLASLVKEES